MELVRRISSMKEVCRQARSDGRKVGFVPTMGALHEGHLSLIRRVKELVDVTVVSIFVNPTQFEAGDDLRNYPRDLAGDADRCVAEDVDYVFAPSGAEMFADSAVTFVDVGELGTRLEGSSRPGHFRGVATVVLKLFEIVRPNIAAFGQKDYQQSVVIRKMVADLMMDVEILVLPTVRDDDGLAMSSRNRRLDAEDREAALAVPDALDLARNLASEGQRQADKIVAAARARLEQEERLEVDYVQLVDQTLQPVSQVDEEAVLVVAVKAGQIRLLDNCYVRP